LTRNMRRFRRPAAGADAARHDRSARGIVWLNALIGSLASLGALATHTLGVMPRGALAVAALVLLAAPRLATVQWRRRGAESRGMDGNTALVAVVLAQVFAVGAIAVYAPVALLPAALLAAQGHLARRADADLPAGGSLALGASQGLVAFVFDPRALTLAMFLLGFVTAIVGGVVVHGRAARRNVERVVDARAMAPAVQGALGARMRYAITLSFIVLVCAFFFDATARAAWRWWDGLASDGVGRGLDRRGAGPLGGPAGYGSR